MLALGLLLERMMGIAFLEEVNATVSQDDIDLGEFKAVNTKRLKDVHGKVQIPMAMPSCCLLSIILGPIRYIAKFLQRSTRAARLSHQPFHYSPNSRFFDKSKQQKKKNALLTAQLLQTIREGRAFYCVWHIIRGGGVVPCIICGIYVQCVGALYNV